MRNGIISLLLLVAFSGDLPRWLMLRAEPGRTSDSSDSSSSGPGKTGQLAMAENVGQPATTKTTSGTFYHVLVSYLYGCHVAESIEVQARIAPCQTLLSQHVLLQI